MINDILLREVLQSKINNMKEYPRTYQQKVEFEMAKSYNVQFGMTADMFNDVPPYNIDNLDYNLLYKLMTSIKKVINESNMKLDGSDLDENKYFNQTEIEDFKIPFVIEKEEFDLRIPEFRQDSDTKYMIFTDIDNVIIWRNWSKLRYNPATQRDLIIREINNKKSKTFDLNRNAINAIKSRMAKNSYYNVPIILNVDPTLGYIPYIEKKELVIPKEAHIDIIEGFHNFIAATEYKDECDLKGIEFNYNMEFHLMLLTTDQANDLIAQMDEKTHFKEEQKVRINRLDDFNYVVKNLFSDPDFYLVGQLDSNMFAYLQKLMSKLYVSLNGVPEKLILIEIFRENINKFIQKTKKFQGLSKREYFALFIFIKYCTDNEIAFSDLLKYDSVIDCIVYNDRFEIFPKTIREFQKKIKEELKNVL